MNWSHIEIIRSFNVQVIWINPFWIALQQRGLVLAVDWRIRVKLLLIVLTLWYALRQKLRRLACILLVIRCLSRHARARCHHTTRWWWSTTEVVKLVVGVVIFRGYWFTLCLIDLESSKVNKNLLKSSPCQCEISYTLIFVESRKFFKYQRQTITLSHKFKLHFIWEFKSLCTIYKLINVGKLGMRQFFFHVETYVEGRYLLLVLFNNQRVTMTISLFKVTWCSINYKATVDHDRYVVTELLSFIHSVCCEKNWRITQFFHHSKEGTSWNRIYPCCWFIKIFNFRAEHEGLCTAEFAFVAST